jgi:WD40 repeat protein
VASSGSDDTIRIWDLSLEEPTGVQDRHQSEVKSIMLLSNSNVIAARGSHWKLWDVETVALQQTIIPAGISLSPDGRFCLTGPPHDYGRYSVLNTATNKLVFEVKLDSQSPVKFEFSPDSRLVAHAYEYFHYYEDEEGLEISTGHGLNTTDWKRLTDDLPIVTVWDIVNGTLLHTFHGVSRFIRALTFSPNSELLAVGSLKREGFACIEIRDLASGQIQQTLRVQKELEQSGLIWSPDAKLIASFSPDATVNIWDVASGTLRISIPPESTSPINCIQGYAFSHDGTLVLSRYPEPGLTLWDVRTGTLIGKRKLDFLSTSGNFSENALCFSDDGKTILTQQGRLDVRSFYSTWDRIGSRDFYVEKDWVIEGTRKILRLPIDYRATCAITVRDTLIMGHVSGHVTFLRGLSEEVA